ncbi:MAG: hypothetical protein ABI435_05070 [Pseudolysinimonas sp.]
MGQLAVLLARPDGSRQVLVLHQGYRLDDHDAPGIAHLGGNDFIAAFTGHGNDSTLGVARLQIGPGGIREGLRTTVTLSAPATYAHLLEVGDPSGRLLILTRSINWNPTGLWLDPVTLEVSEPFLAVPGAPADGDPNALGGSGGRPYLVTRQIAGSALVALVNDHPLSYRNGIVVAELAAGAWRRIDGTQLRAIDDPTPWDPFTELDVVVEPGGDWVPWVHDVQQDVAGRTAVAWSERHRPRAGETAIPGLRYRVAERGSDGWRVGAPWHAGSALYDRELDYAGGIAFAADSVDRLTFVSDVDPFSGLVVPPQRRRRFDLRRDNDRVFVRQGAQESGEQLRPRPATPIGVGVAHATWMLSGEYRKYTDFDTRAELLVHEPGVSCFRAGDRHVDLPFGLGEHGAMPPIPRAALADYLAAAEQFLEFGAGSSTLIALAAGVRRIASVDFDADLLDALEMVADAQGHRARFESRLVAVDQISDEGYPVGDHDVVATGRRYVAAGLDVAPPPLVLIGGRYRVASFLEVLKAVTEPTVVLWDDYLESGHYHLVEEIMSPTQFFEGLAMFAVPAPIAVPDALLDRAYRDPR